MNRDMQVGAAPAESGVDAGPAPGPESAPAQAAPARGLWEVLVLGALGGVRGDERAAFREAFRRALRRPVLPHQAMRLRLSAAILALLGGLVATGVLLTYHYQPTVGGAWSSVQAVDQTVSGGWFLRQMHLWCGRGIVLLAALALLRMLYAADYKDRGYDKWIASHLLLFVLLAFFATGAALPGGAWAVDATQSFGRVLADVPVFGGVLRAFLIEPQSDPQVAMTRNFLAHVVFLPWAMFFLVIVVHSTRTRPRSLALAAPWELVGRAAPLWPDRVTEAAIAVVLALGGAAAAAFAFPSDLGPATAASGDSVVAGPGIDPALRAFTGVAGLFPARADGGFLSGPGAGLALLCAAAGAFFALAFLDRSPERTPRLRRRIVVTGGAIFVAILCVNFLGKARP